MPLRQQPSKLFNLREWLTLDEAAKHLSIVFGEEVTRTDVMRFALDGHLTLSVDFVNHADARQGRLVPLEQCPLMICTKLEIALAANTSWIRKKGVFQADIPNLDREILDGLQSGDLFITPDALVFGEGEFLILNDEVTSIRGIWDLTMKGAEALDVEHLYQAETGGPEVTLTTLEGPFVRRGGIVSQLQEDFEQNAYCPGSKAQGEEIERRIADEELTKSQADELRQKYAEKRKIFLDQRKSKTRAQCCFPAGKLPDDAVYVIRTAALREFEESVFGAETGKKKQPSKREESSLLNIIGGLLGLLLDKTPAGKPQSVFKSQAAVIDALVATHGGKPGISTRTLQDKFAAAKRMLES